MVDDTRPSPRAPSAPLRTSTSSRQEQHVHPTPRLQIVTHILALENPHILALVTNCNWRHFSQGLFPSLSLYLYISTSLHLCISASLHLCISASLSLCISTSLHLYISLSETLVHAASVPNRISRIYTSPHLSLSLSLYLSLPAVSERPRRTTRGSGPNIHISLSVYIYIYI